jgi:plasmid stabilization system protein ParE
VAQDSPSAAAELLERLLKASASLDILAERGRVVPERPDESIRELLVNPFRLVYQVRHAEVIVLALLHQRQDFTRWPERDPRRTDAP